MENVRRAMHWHWQGFVVDVLIVTSSTAVALAAVSTIAEFPLILIATALIGVGLMLDRTEPGEEAQDAREHFDAALVDAASR
jgi:flagellar biosynthesis component FlhA